MTPTRPQEPDGGGGRALTLPLSSEPAPAQAPAFVSLARTMARRGGVAIVLVSALSLAVFFALASSQA